MPPCGNSVTENVVKKSHQEREKKREERRGGERILMTFPIIRTVSVFTCYSTVIIDGVFYCVFFSPSKVLNDTVILTQALDLPMLEISHLPSYMNGEILFGRRDTGGLKVV